MLNAERKLTPSWSLLKPSIQLVKANIVTLLYVSVLPLFIVTAGMLFLRNTTFTSANDTIEFTSRQLLGFGLLGLGALWTLLVYPAYVLLQVRAIRGEVPSIGESLRGGFAHFFRFIGLTLIVGLVTTAGFLFFIVPGLIFLRRYALSPYYLIDQKLSIFEAMKKSADESKPVSMYVWGVLAVSIVLSLIGSALEYIPVIGIIASAFISLSYSFAIALRYGEIAHNLPVITEDK